MKHVIESVEELYHAREPTGEIIIDAVTDALRKTRTHRSEDIALLLYGEPRALSFAVEMLTGIRLNDLILHWRVLQAKEQWDVRQARYEAHNAAVEARRKETPEGYELSEKFVKAHRGEISVQSLDAIARRYGWQSHKSLQRIARKFGVSFPTIGYVTN